MRRPWWRWLADWLAPGRQEQGPPAPDPTPVDRRPPSGVTPAADRPRGAIGLADLLIALDRLGVGDDVTAARIARALGFSGLDPNPPEQVRGAWAADRQPPPPATPSPPPAPRPPALPPPLPLPALPDAILDTELLLLAPLPAAPPPPWLDNAPILRPPAPALRRQPLLPRRTAPGVLAAAIATRRPGGAPDLPRLLAALVRGTPPRRLPLRPEAGLDRGLHLLLDTAPAMAPFRADLTDLAAALQRLLGAGRCPLFEFDGDPGAALGWHASDGPRRWRPEPGRPVLIATELSRAAPPGRFAPPPAACWRRFTARLHRAGCPLILLLPLPPARWPARLARRATLIHWDPRTSAADVRRVVGPGHG